MKSRLPVAQSGDNGRLHAIDALRGVAMIMVVIIHVTASRVVPGTTAVATLINASARLGVALFFAISGYLDQGSHRRRADWRPWIQGRIFFLFRTYVLASLFYLFLNQGIGLGLPWTGREAVLYGLFGQAEWHLWYLIALAETVLGYWLLRRWGVSPYSLVWVASAVWLIANQGMIQSHSLGRLMTYHSLIDWVIYYALGAAVSFRQESAEVERHTGLTVRAILILIYLGYCVVGVAGAYARSLTLGRLLWFGLSLVMVTSLLAQASTDRTAKWSTLAPVGKHSMWIFLMHMLVVRGATSIGWLHQESPVAVIAEVAIAVGLVLTASALLDSWGPKCIRTLRSVQENRWG